MQDVKQKIALLTKDFADIYASVDLEAIATQIADMEKETQREGLWDDPEKASGLMRKLERLKEERTLINGLQAEINAINDLSVEGQLDGLEEEVSNFEAKLTSLRLKTFLSGEYDSKNAIVSIHAGQGGTEAMDWAGMLYRMYLRFCERKGWKTVGIDQSDGEEAGIKSVSFRVEGDYAYGNLKNESGTHRLVRQSPFNADKLRQTSFAMVEVLPELDAMDVPDMQLKDEELEWQFFRSGGHGGQNVNKVSTAVRVKHIPTGIVVSAQTERYQEQNRKNALKMLLAKLWLLEKAKETSKIQNLKGEYKPASWGTQIRSYVLHPYKMVKDLRTNFESGNPDAVLDGDLEGFIEAELKIVAG